MTSVSIIVALVVNAGLVDQRFLFASLRESPLQRPVSKLFSYEYAAVLFVSSGRRWAVEAIEERTVRIVPVRKVYVNTG